MLEDERPVVINATPIISLGLIDQLEILRKFFPRLLVPAAVHHEILAGGSHRPGARQFAAASWIEVVPLKDPSRADFLADLDRGEAEVLAQETDARLVILDERLARRHATRLGFKLTGTVGLLLRAKEEGLIQRLEPFLARMQQGGIRLSGPLIQEALQLAGEHLSTSLSSSWAHLDRLGCSLVSRVADVAPFDVVDDVLGDVGGVGEPWDCIYYYG